MAETAIVLAAKKIKEVRTVLYRDDMLHEMVRAVGSDSRVERMISLGINAVKQNPAIARDCEARSIIGSIIEATQLNLELDKNLGQAYLVPLRDKHRGNKTFCNMWIGYRGFIKLASNTTVRRVNAEVVRVGDQFKIVLGTNRSLVHIPDLVSKGRDLVKNWVGAYAAILHADGTQDFEFLTAEEILGVKAKSPGKNAKAWTEFEIEMWKKTPIRRILKRVPQSPENVNLIHAAIIDENRQFGLGGRHKLDGAPSAPILEEFMPDDTAPPDVAPETKEVQRKSDPKTAPAVQASARNQSRSTSAATEPCIDDARVSAIRGMKDRKKISDADFAQLMKEVGVEQASDMTMSQFNQFWTTLVGWKGGVK